MKATSYLANLAVRGERKNDWYTVKAGAGAVQVAQTTEHEVMQIAGEIHDLSLMDPADLIEMFEDYEDPECETDEWGVL